MIRPQLLRYIKTVCSAGFNNTFSINKSSKLVRRLTAILRIIDITTFFYIRINRNSQFFILSDNNNISNYLINKTRCIGEFLGRLTKTSVCGKISVALWPDAPCDHFLYNIYQFGAWNGISVTLAFNDYIDIFSFASSVENSKINNFYLNYIRLIKRFIIFFRLKGKKIIAMANQELCSLNEEIELYASSQLKQEKIIALKDLRTMTPLRKIPIRSTCLKKIFLTQKETKYLLLLLEGKSMRTIAEELHISKRSVESCLNSAKSKTGYGTKIELLAAFLDTHLYQPSVKLEDD